MIRQFRVRATSPEEAHEKIVYKIEQNNEDPIHPFKLWECQPDWWECSVIVCLR